MVAPTTVTYALDTPGGSARPGVTVTATLAGAGDRNDTPGVVGSSVTTTTDNTGAFSLSLLPNSVYHQAATYYAVNIAGGPSYNIVVPTSDTPVDLWGLRVDPRTLDPIPAPVASTYLLRTERAAANGVASLGANGKVPTSQLPASSGGDAVTSVNNQLPDVDGNVTLTAANVGAAATSHTHPQSDVTGLTASLAAKADLVGGKVPQSQIPAVALVDFLGAVASQAAMLALAGQRGDWATRTDLGTDWQLIADDSTQLASWREMTYPASPVSSVAGRTGAVVLTKSDVGLSNVDNTSDANKPISTAAQAALDLKAPLASPTFTGTVSGITKTMVGLGNVDNTSDANKPVSTAQQTALDGKLSLSLADNKGDLFVASADNTIVKVAVGSNNQVLTADSTQTAGVKWAAAAGGSSGENDVYGPVGSGFGEWTCDPLLLTTNFATNSGLLILVRHKFRAAMTVDEIGFCLQQAGVTPGAYSGVAVYADGTGTVAKQGESADAGSSFTSTGLKSIALTSGVAVSAGEFRWIGYLWQGTSPPRLYAPPGPADQVALNVGRRRSVFLTGQTAFPSSVDISAATANTTTYWFSFKDV